MQLTLKDGSKMSFDGAMSALDVTKHISEGLARAAIVCRIDGKLASMDTIIDKDCNFEVLTFNDEDGKKVYRHTCAHILAQAVRNIYPTVQLAIGPAVDNGFYYDFDFKTPITQADFEKIEAEMKSIIKANLPITRIECSREEAGERIAKMKDGVCIINTSRGTNVDEAALLAALESGKVRAAGLDVYADEPASNSALYSHPMVSCTPHIGSATVEAQGRIGEELVEIISKM